MMRLDKYLCDSHQGSRSQVKTYIKKGLVTVNGEIIKKAEYKVDEQRDLVMFQNMLCQYQKHVYYMLNKPAGVVSATKDNTCKTVIDLFVTLGRDDLFPVGRLDKDTLGLLLVTNDGILAHNLLAPKKKVDKTYYVGAKFPLLKEDIIQIEQGLDIGDKDKTLPAKIKLVENNLDLEAFTFHLTIQEGRYHQVKRMLHAVNNEVVYLKRISFGALVLDEDLPQGTFRELTTHEMILLQN